MEFHFRRHFRLRPKTKMLFGRPLVYITKRYGLEMQSLGLEHQLGLGLEIKVLIGLDLGLEKVLITSLN